MEEYLKLPPSELDALIKQLLLVQQKDRLFRETAESFLRWYGIVYTDLLKDVGDDHFKPPQWINWAQLKHSDARLHGYLNSGDCGLFALCVGEVLKRAGFPVEYWDNGRHVYFGIGDNCYDSLIYLTGKRNVEHGDMFGGGDEDSPKIIDRLWVPDRGKMTTEDLEFMETFLKEYSK
jgi:hypothetical protein